MAGRATNLQQMLIAALQHHQASRLESAERLYREILDVEPSDADALHLYGVLSLQTGRSDIAIGLIGKAIAQDERVPAFHNSLGNAYQLQGRFEDAVRCYRRTLTLKPDLAQAHYNLGTALKEQGKLKEAAASLRWALALKPDYAEAYNQLGMVLQLEGKFEEALASYDQALLHRRSYVEALYSRGTVLQAQGKSDDAVESYRQVLLLMPNCAEAHSNLGTLLYEAGKSDEAEASFRRALALKPDYAGARLELAMASIPIFTDSIAKSAATTGHFLRALEDLAAWGDAHPGALGKVVGSSQPYQLMYRPQDITTALLRYGELVCRASAETWPSSIFKQPPPRERIRIVVVCGYVQERHPVWNVVLKGVIANLDRRRFEVVLYHTGVVIDEETAWAKSQVARFVQGPKTIKAWLEEIAQDRPDVIFYPEVGMEAATCALAALRLAPLQVLGQGNPMTTGFSTMDIYFSGEFMEGPDADQHYSEKLIQLPGTGLCLEWPTLGAQRWDGPERPSGVVRFALWLQPIKFDPADDVLFARIAKAAGPCEFWFPKPTRLSWTGQRLHDRMAAAFRAEGLDPDAHLRLGPWLSRSQMLGFFDTMDIYLDSPAFSGCTTAWQALHRGLPIITLEGAFLRQRQTAGLLRQIGITDGIVSNRDAYVATAVRWAQECRRSEEWTERRDAIRRAAPKMDGNIAAVRAFERTLTDALHTQHACGRTPCHSLQPC